MSVSTAVLHLRMAGRILMWRPCILRKESPLAPQLCTVELNHQDCNGVEVGTETRAVLKLVRANSAAYCLKHTDTFSCQVTHNSSPIPLEHKIEPEFLVGQISISISFTAQLAGKYRLDLRVNNTTVAQTPILITYVPGVMDGAKSELSIIDPRILTRGTTFVLYLTPKDKYGNITAIKKHLLRLNLQQNSCHGEAIHPNLVICKSLTRRDCLELKVKLNDVGYFLGNVTYNGQQVGPAGFSIICLNERDAQVVDRNVAAKRCHVCFHATTLSGSTVRCILTPQTLDVRQKKLGFVPCRLYACRTSPSSKITLDPEADVITLDNGTQEPLKLCSRERCVIAALFSKLSLENVGGSESFSKKQRLFYEQLKEHHRLGDSCSRKKIVLNVKRQDILKTAMQATRRFSAADWLKKFDIEFDNEDAIDFGGPSKEFVDLLCRKLFNGDHKYFVQLDSDNKQAPVHPNHHNTSYKCFEFAGKIVAKCVVECALNNFLLVRAKFTRAFLCQLLGLKVGYQCYSTDDPVYYRNKVQFTLQTDVTEEELFFTDTAENAPLVLHGRKKRVTEQNKEQYLHTLAHYRLVKQPSRQIQFFLKGFTTLVPCDLLLTFFTVNELELLICGTEEVLYEDMRKFSLLEGEGPHSGQVLSWFWATVQSSLSSEERAMLLQFVTGSSILPQGGFEKLTPPFTISIIHDDSRLPTAHTCINTLYLPEYKSRQKLHASLMTAIRSDDFQLC